MPMGYSQRPVIAGDAASDHGEKGIHRLRRLVDDALAG